MQITHQRTQGQDMARSHYWRKGDRYGNSYEFVVKGLPAAFVRRIEGSAFNDIRWSWFAEGHYAETNANSEPYRDRYTAQMDAMEYVLGREDGD